MNKDNSLINFETLNSFWGDDSEIKQEMLICYITDIPTYLTNLKKALFEQDFHQIYYYSHCIKGASLSTAILMIPDHCAKIETLAQKSNLEGINDLIREIETTFEKVKELIISIDNIAIVN